MHAIRSSALVALSALGLVAAACSSSPSDTAAATETNESALVVDNAEAPASSTLSSASCTSIDDLVEANAEALRGLCKPGQVPVPQDITDDGCEEGSATSVTFKCVAAKHHPKPPKDGCQEFDIKDDHQAIPEKGGKHVHRLHPVLCPLMGHAAPPKGDKGCEGGPAGGPPPPPPPGGPKPDGGPGAPPPPPPPPGDGGAPPPPPPPPGDGGPAGPGAGGPPPPPPGDGGPAHADGGPAGPHPHKKGPPKIRCCAPPPPPGGPGGGPGAPPPPGGPKGDGAPPPPPAPPAPPAPAGSGASSTPT